MSMVEIPDLETLPATAVVPEVAALCRVSTDHVYDLIANGEFPVQVLKFGRSIRVPLRPLMGVLGISADEVRHLLKEMKG